MQCLAEVAAMPNVTIQVVPAIAHAGVASAYLLADDAVWCEHLAVGGVLTIDREASPRLRSHLLG